MRRLPIRARLTAAFALALLLVLAGAGAFVHQRLKADLEEAIDAGLATRAAAVALNPTAPLDPADQPEESFTQILTLDAAVLDAAGGARGAALTAAELKRPPRSIDRQVPGIEGTARLQARRAGDRVVVVGRSLDDRDEALGSVVSSFAIGGAFAIVLASALGYALATSGLAPMEAMRRRAAQLEPGGGRLPLPAANDEVRRLGATLNAMLDRQEEAFERERRFVADASHELRTPVAVIKAELEAAARMPDLGPESREALHAAVSEADHLAQLAEDLLVVARAAGGRLPVRPEAIPAAELLEGVRDRFADRATAVDRTITTDAPNGLVISADPLRLRQALGNLVDNALRHGEGAIRVNARQDAGGAALEVADGGRGFSAEIAATAFERFARGERARPERGAGLGLAIVRAIAEAHGGTAEIVAGHGAVVRLWLPDT